MRLIKRSIIFYGIAVILLLNLAPAALAADINVVPGPNAIQEAINGASAGDSIYVGSGTYSESVLVNRSVNIYGRDTGSGTPVIDAGGSDGFLLQDADNILLDGFIINNADTGVRIHSYNDTVSNCTIIDAVSDGVKLEAGLSNIIENNMTGCGIAGINITGPDSKDNSLRYNDIYDSINGISVSGSYNNYFNGNNISGSTVGILLDRSNSSHFYYNSILNSTGYGIRILNSNNNEFDNNQAKSNGIGYGIYIYASENNTFLENNANHDQYGIYLASGCRYNVFVLNFFVDNQINGTVESGVLYNRWNNTISNNTYKYKGKEFTNHTGNIWGNLYGPDANSDGMCDIPYVLSENNTDYNALLNGVYLPDPIHDLPPQVPTLIPKPTPHVPVSVPYLWQYATDATPTPIPTAEATPTPTVTATPTMTPTPTPTPMSTATPTPEPQQGSVVTYLIIAVLAVFAIAAAAYIFLRRK